MQTIKTMWKTLFQNRLNIIYKANLPSFVQKIIKSCCYVHLSRWLRLKCHPKMAACMRKANLNENLYVIEQEITHSLVVFKIGIVNRKYSCHQVFLNWKNHSCWKPDMQLDRFILVINCRYLAEIKVTRH